MTCSDESIRVCGWDVGGAHLKFAALTADLRLVAAEQLICPLWEDTAHLRVAIDALRERYDFTQARHAVTMTGELCDNFKTRRDGVRLIVEILEKSFADAGFSLYGLRGSWISPQNSAERIAEIASANWSASAQFLASRVDSAVIIDIGSTTTDVICVRDGKVMARGVDDFSRLKYRELIYTGLVRTPIAAVVNTLPYGDAQIPVVAETFATVADAYRILENLPQDADLYPTADGAGKTAAASARRMFRMIGRDYDGEFGQAQAMAAYVREAQLNHIGSAVEAHGHELFTGVPEAGLLGMGCGAHLVELLARRFRLKYDAFDDFISMTNGYKERLQEGEGAAVCGPAIAVAHEYAASLRGEEGAICEN